MRLWPIFVTSVALLFAHIASAQSLKPNEVISSITVRPISEPNPVLAADGRRHLAYELLVVNTSSVFVKLDKVEAVDGTGSGLLSLDGDRLAAMIKPYGGTGPLLSPGQSAVVLLDVSFTGEAQLPSIIFSKITATRQIAGADGKPAPFPTAEPVPATFSFTDAGTRIGKAAVAIAPPVKGNGWVVMNGCCDSITSHRGAVMAINGQLRVPERFAIDWLKLDDTGRAFSGDDSKLASYAYYGTEIHAVADGVVVNSYDGAEEQIPGADAKGITTENIGGNMLVVDIGGGAYAFYAHMQRGSLRVMVGDHVTTGQVIGLLGNTGNSTAPHLHFHVMDGPSPLDSNGLPFVFTHFSSSGVLNPVYDDALFHGETARIDPRLAGDHVNEMPLNTEVINFD